MNFLATRPDDVAALREELDKAVDDYGWTKKAIDKLVKMDSYLKETQRVIGVDTSKSRLLFVLNANHSF
jgi:hypothetical protein